MSAIKMKIKDITILTVLLLSAIFYFIYSADALQGIKNGLSICATVLIPSLFPFMIISSITSETRAAKFLSAPLAPITKYVFKLPARCGIIILMSLIGGFPIGATLISDYLKKGIISKNDAEYMLSFCVNAGPAFIITAVGINLFNSAEIGFVILFSFITNIIKSSGIIAFVLSFSGDSTFIFYAQSVLLGVLEVTCGSVNISKSGGVLSVCLIASFISFSSFSIWSQIKSVIGKSGISFKKFILSRIISAPLSFIICKILLSFSSEVVSTAANLNNITPIINSKNSLSSCLLLILCAVFTVYISDIAARNKTH